MRTLEVMRRAYRKQQIQSMWKIIVLHFDKQVVWACARRLSVRGFVHASCKVSLGFESRNTIQMCEVFTLLGCYTAKICSQLPNFGSLSVPFSRFKQVNKNARNIQVGSYIGNGVRCTKTSLNDGQSTLLNIPEHRISHLYRDGSLKSLNLSVLSDFRASVLLKCFKIGHGNFVSRIYRLLIDMSHSVV